MNNLFAKLSQKKFFYPITFAIFMIISFLPPVTEKPSSPENTQQVIIELLKVAIYPYERLGIIFHITTIILAIWTVVNPAKSRRALYAYMGIDLIIIALAQSFGTTKAFGDIIHTGGLVAFVLLGILWIWAAIMDGKEQNAIKWQWQHTALLPFAILSFWAPYRVSGDVVFPDFTMMRILTAPDYGLAFCFTAPVFLYLMFILYPAVNVPIYRLTAFNGLLYALFNLSHWFNQDTRWMGALHVPLLVISITALIQTRMRKIFRPSPKISN